MIAPLAIALSALLAAGPASAAPGAAAGPPAARPEAGASPEPGAGSPPAPAGAPPSPSDPAPAPPPASTGSPAAGPAAPAAPPPASTAGPAPTSLPAVGGPPCPADLFRIRRSTNANEVVYAARLDEAGRLDEDDPLDAYWLMHAEDGHREGLNILEKMLAYGFSADPAPEGGFRVVLKAKKDRPVHLALQDGCPVALIEVAGRQAHLRSIFVQTSSGGVIPTVAHVDLTGVDPASGREVTERILPN